MNPAIDVSTHELAEHTAKAMGGKTPVEDILAVWHEIGTIVKQQMVQHKAVRLTSFGTFSFNAQGEPIFLLASEFASQFKVKQRGQIPPANVPTSAINFSAVQQNTGTARETVEKIYTKFMTSLGRVLFEGRSVVLTFHRVAEIQINKGEVTCDMMPEFKAIFGNIQPSTNKSLEQLRNAAKKTSKMMTATKMFEAGIKREKEFEGRYNTTLDIGDYGDGYPARTRQVRPASAGRNPITGQRNQRPGSAGRPSSAGYSNDALLRSPRGGDMMNYTDNYRRPNSGSGLTREALARNAQTQRAQTPDRLGMMRGNRNNQEEGVDARRVAAKALDTGDIVNKVRSKIIERGGSNGIRSITRLLSIMDDNGDKRLTRDELRYGLRDYGIDLTPTELEQVFLYFDRDRNGFIDVTEFLVGIRGALSERRRSIVQLAFNVLDKDGSGEISVDEVLQCYDLNWHPEVRAGKMTVKEAARDFMKVWDKQEADGIITFSEFEDYYKEISASIDDDDYFELMIRNAWRISGGTGMAANTANRRVLVTNKDGSQSVQTIEQELGMRRGDKEDMRARLARQGVQAEGIELYGGFEDVQNPRNGRAMPVSNNRQSYPTVPGRSKSNPRASRESPRAPREAWLEGPPRPGDQNMPDDYQPSPRPGSNRPASRGFDPFETLHKILYTPPVSLEMLCIKLQVSSVNTSPRVAQGAFIKRLSTLEPSLDRSKLQAIWKVVDPKNLGSVEVSTVHNLLSDRYGKDRTANKNASVIDRVIKKILERCGESAGIKGLSRALAVMDNSGDKRLTKEELKYGLQDYGIELNLRELDDIFTYFDRDHNGFVDINELLVGVRGDLNERRKKIVQLAFNSLDVDRSGVVTVDEIMDNYNFKAHPDVVAGKKTIQEAAREFMKTWDKQDSDGLVTYEEFEDYYKEISASIDGDDYFELMIRNAWRIAGGTGMAANTANRRVLVTNKDGSQSVQTIEQELGMRRGDKEDMRARLARQGVQAEGIELYGGFEDVQKPRSGGRGPPQRGRAHPQAVPQRAPQRNQNEPTMFEKNAAAMKLAAAYRGRLGRKQASQEKRKVEAQERDFYAEQEEMNRPRPREINRPKGKSYIGF